VGASRVCSSGEQSLSALVLCVTNQQYLSHSIIPPNHGVTLNEHIIQHQPTLVGHKTISKICGYGIDFLRASVVDFISISPAGTP
jgi:hypothetical protein